MNPEDLPRFAIYFAPSEDSALWRMACAWLGRDPATDTPVERPDLDWIGRDEAKDITESPRHYGFHGTLKAPFALAAGKTVDDLDEALGTFASTASPFTVPLTTGVLDGFVALRPAEPSRPLHALADACVETFDRFRAPPAPDELVRRRRNGLTSQQDAALARWGYPYVFETYRFHMTLTGRLDEPRRARVHGHLSEMFAPILAAPVAVESVCLFRQPSRRAPFRLIRRYRLGAPS